ncbi:MAG: hypothetical protein V7L25_03095 [Nostoc sp.]|uniref:hypothetical protein n=1 Tax=Nostoc sp. TaxID=1180 RepID=UPI002FF25705
MMTLPSVTRQQLAVLSPINNSTATMQPVGALLKQLPFLTTPQDRIPIPSPTSPFPKTLSQQPP